MHEIFIYGDIVPFKWWDGSGEYDLNDLNKDLLALNVKEGDTVTANINTLGGCTVTGFAMFNKLRRFAADNKVNIRTRVDGFCASIGVVILLAGDVRIGNAYAEPFVHNAWTWSWSLDKNDAKKIFDDLTKTDNSIASCYADRTNITVEKALELMNADTWISPEDCMTFGFYTELENVLVSESDSKEVFNSLRQKRNNNNFNNMAKNKKDASSLWNQIQNAAKKHLGLDTVNKIVLTAESEELDFYELAEDEIPVVKSDTTSGSKATFDGKPAGESNDGEYLLASGETYKFEGEELVEIIAAEEENTDSEDATKDEQIENLTEQVNSLKKKLKASENKLKETQNKLTESEKIVKQIAELDPDDDEEDEDEPVGRDPKKQNKSTEVKTRNLFQYIK